MLRTAGFPRVEIVQRPRGFPYSVWRGLRRKRHGLDPFRRAVSYGRLTAHAFKP